MGKSKELFQDTRILVEADEELMRFFIRTWHEFCPRDQSPEELAESVQNNFGIKCTEDDVIGAFGLDIEEDDIKFQVSNLGLYY